MGQQVDRQAKSPPVQFAAYILQKNVINFFFLVVWGMLLNIFVKFEFTRNLLLKYPDICTFGIFKKRGPTANQIKETEFRETFIAKGYKKKEAATGKYDTEIKYTVSGPGMRIAMHLLIDSYLLSKNSRTLQLQCAQSPRHTCFWTKW